MSAKRAKDDEEPIDDRRMPFTEHLAELRTRLRNAVAAVFAATVIGFIFKEQLLALMVRPLDIAWSHAPPGVEHQLNFTNLIEPFMVYFKLALFAGVLAASPVIFHQLWKFISPGLYARERRMALPFVVASVILFVGGAAFAYQFVLPAGYAYFLKFTSDSMGVMKDILGQHDIHLTTTQFAMHPMLTVDEYFGLTTTLLLVFGAAFELPLLLSVLAIIGIVTPRGLWRFNRYAILIAFVLGAILTPGDLVVGQVAMGGSLTILYNLSIVVALIVGRNKRKRREAEEAAEKAERAAEAEARAITKAE